MKNVWIAVPAYSGQIHLGTCRSILTDLLYLHGRGDSFTVYDEAGNTDLYLARAVIVAKFLDSRATDLIFVDSDVYWEAGTIAKLLDVPVDCVAAVYPHRTDPITYPISWDRSQKELWADSNGLIEVEGVPLGCTRCSRSMLEKMVEHYSDLEFYCDVTPGEKAWGLFDPYRIDNLKLSEDYSFCRRWRDMGGKIHIHPETKMAHVGLKTYTGNIGLWLRNREETNGIIDRFREQSGQKDSHSGNGGLEKTGDSGFQFRP